MLANSMRFANITKPQLAFEHPVDNEAIWKPVLSKKPNAIVPLEKSITSFKNDLGLEEYVTGEPRR